MYPGLGGVTIQVPTQSWFSEALKSQPGWLVSARSPRPAKPSRSESQPRMSMFRLCLAASLHRSVAEFVLDVGAPRTGTQLGACYSTETDAVGPLFFCTRAFKFTRGCKGFVRKYYVRVLQRLSGGFVTRLLLSYYSVSLTALVYSPLLPTRPYYHARQGSRIC